jgi:hypothetical protein
MGTLDCGHAPSEHSDSTTGYGTDASGKRHCWDCIARMDIEAMRRDGNSKHLPLYLSKHSDGVWRITNWPGSLSFTPWYLSHAKVNGFGRMQPRVSARFNGPDGFVWSGFQQGDWNQIFHARRTKQRSESAV